MKEKIKKWLGFHLLEEDTRLNLLAVKNLENRMGQLEQDFRELFEKQKYLNMYIKGMLDYFDLDYHREEIKDPRIIYNEPTVPIIKITKRSPIKRKKFTP